MSFNDQLIQGIREARAEISRLKDEQSELHLCDCDNCDITPNNEEENERLAAEIERVEKQLAELCRYAERNGVGVKE